MIYKYLKNPVSGLNDKIMEMDNDGNVLRFVPMVAGNADYEALLVLIGNATITVLASDPLPDQMIGKLSAYRDAQIEIEVSYDGIYAMNTAETRADLVSIKNFLFGRGEDMVIYWSGPQGRQTVSSMQIDGLIDACEARRQSCYQAEALTYAQHVQTPFATEAAMQTAFNDFMEA